MKEKDITQHQLEELADLGSNSLSAYLSYKTSPRTDVIEKICSTLNCNIDDIIFWKEGDYAKEEEVYIKWDKLTVSLRKLSMSLNRGCDYLLSKKNNNRTVLLSQAEKIAELCNMNVKELVDEI